MFELKLAAPTVVKPASVTNACEADTVCAIQSESGRVTIYLRAREMIASLLFKLFLRLDKSKMTVSGTLTASDPLFIGFSDAESAKSTAKPNFQVVTYLTNAGASELSAFL